MSIFSILNIAKGSLAATQTSIQVTSNNISNVNTAGYAREEAVLVEQRPVPSPVGLLGDGVTIKDVKRYYDKYLESSIQSKNSDLQEQTVLSTYLDRIQQFLNEDNSNLTGNITAYFNDWESLSADPSDTGLKQTLESQGESVAQTIKTLYTDLKGVQSEVNDQIGSEVDSVNTILSSIAAINKLIIQSSGASSNTNSYQDQKADLLNQLSQKMDIQAFDDRYGRTTVLTADGRPLVENGTAWQLSTAQNPLTGYSKIMWNDGNGVQTDVSAGLGGGKLKALVDIRDSYAPAFVGDLNDLANSLIDNVKWTATSGGVSNTTSFFQGTGAADIQVATSIVNNPNLIGASSDPVNNPTDNDIAMRMASLADKKLLGTQQLVHISGADALSDTFSSATTVMTGLVGLSSAWSGTVQIRGMDGTFRNVAIDLASDSLTDIRDRINAAGATGVTASIAASTVNGVTQYALKVTNVDAADFKDQNNVLQTLGVVTRSSTLTDFTSSMVNYAGQVAQDAQNATQYNTSTMAVLTGQRESVSGVSLDEEMANLIKFQYAYQASAKLFTVADELLQTLISVKS
ncbi:MAG TPA: flagellar hook-associated protein FlgK [Syntrophorhabdaceae bacterium]